MLTYVSSIVFSLHTYSLNSASEHTNLSSVASANKTLQFIAGRRELTSYQTFCLHLDVFQLAQLSRETSLTLSVPMAFLQIFSLPPWWTLSSIGWCTSKQQYGWSLCTLLVKEMLSWGWRLNRTEGWGKRCSGKCFPSCHLAWLSWIVFDEEGLPEYSSSCVHHSSSATALMILIPYMFSQIV